MLLWSNAVAAEVTPKISAERARAAAEVIGQWATEKDNLNVLAAALELALAGGASLNADDPWSVHDLSVALIALPGGADVLSNILQTNSRGVVSGATRFEATLAPGARKSVSLIMAKGENAVIEARLKRGSHGADLDLVVFADGKKIADDTGPLSGTDDVSAYVAFVPDTCLAITVEVLNNGEGTANAVFLAPATNLIGCGE